MLLGNKEKTIKLHAENFLIGNITFDYGITDDEREVLQGPSKTFAEKFLSWLHEEEQDNKSEPHKLSTLNLYNNIIFWRIRGRIKGVLVDIDLETRIEEIVREKVQLEDEIKKQKEDILKAINTLKDQDRQIALLESQIFYLRQGKNNGI